MNVVVVALVRWIVRYLPYLASNDIDTRKLGYISKCIHYLYTCYAIILLTIPPHTNTLMYCVYYFEIIK